MTEALEHKLVETIRREGPIRFDRFMEAALYDPEGGFFTAGGGAGRSEGDFITSPEVGSLFGAVVARGVDHWWRELGQPDPFVVVDAGAGRGQLARDVLRAGPECATALRYVMAERSPRLRRLQHEYLQVEPADEALGPAVKLGADDDDPELVPGTGPIVTQTEEIPAVTFEGVIVANELLDNLPFRLVERTGSDWNEIRVGHDDRTLVEVPVPADAALAGHAADLLPDAPEGVRLPVQEQFRDWLDRCSRALRRGFVVVIDYADEASGVAARGPASWLRTYRAHERGRSPFDDPGSQDITADVVLESLREAARREGFQVAAERSQAEWLVDLGVGDLVEEGKRIWEERAHLGDLEAMQARSRVSEAEALLHPAGLGGHRVVVLRKG